MRQTDQCLGWRSFSLTRKRRGIFAAQNGLPAANGLKEPHPMQVTMFRFAAFCVGDSAARSKIIDQRKKERQRREQQRASGNTSGGGGPYAGLLKVLRENHWETNDIRQLDGYAGEFGLAPDGRGYHKKIQTYRCLKEKYVDQWRSEEYLSTAGGVNYLKPMQSLVPLGELSVRVDPEVGMRNESVARALKLWFFKPEALTVLDVCSYLLWEAARQGEWPRFWTLGIWDVRHSRLSDALIPPDEIEEQVHAAAAKFVAMESRS